MDSSEQTTPAAPAESAGRFVVATGSDATIDGEHVGTVDVEGSATLTVTGTVRGSVNIASLGTVMLTGDIVGPVEIKVAGTLVIEQSGRLAGDVTNFGSFTNNGVRIGVVTGRTPDDRPGASATVPVGGIYRLPPRA